MANKKISQFDQSTTYNVDDTFFLGVDTSDATQAASGSNYRVSVGSIHDRIPNKDALVLYLADESPASSYAYTDGSLTSVSYSNYSGITNHTKDITYTSGNISQIVRTFTYDGQTWVVTTDLTYSNDLIATKSITINKIN